MRCAVAVLGGKNPDNPCLMTFLAIDIGNTRLKWAMYDAPRHGASLLAQGAEFLEQIEQLADGPWSRLPAPCCMLGCAVASETTRRRVHEQIDQMLGWDFAPQWVVPSSQEAGVTNGYDQPLRLGALAYGALAQELLDRRDDTGRRSPEQGAHT